MFDSNMHGTHIKFDTMLTQCKRGCMLVEAVLQMFFACVSVQLRKQLSHLIKL